MQLQTIVVLHLQFIWNRLYLISQTELNRNNVTIFGLFSGTISHVFPVDPWKNICKSVDIKYQSNNEGKTV